MTSRPIPNPATRRGVIRSLVGGSLLMPGILSELFAAAVPICGGGDKRLAKKIAEIPVWAWHGDQDGVIKPSRSQDMVAALKAAGANPKYTEVKGRGHNVWTDAFNSAEMWQWLFAQRKD